MPNYSVQWNIDIEAGTPEQAAKQALAIQRDVQSTATVFFVQLQGPCPSCNQHQVHKPTCRLRAQIGGSANLNVPFTVDI